MGLYLFGLLYVPILCIGTTIAVLSSFGKNSLREGKIKYICKMRTN